MLRVGRFGLLSLVLRPFAAWVSPDGRREHATWMRGGTRTERRAAHVRRNVLGHNFDPLTNHTMLAAINASPF